MALRSVRTLSLAVALNCLPALCQFATVTTDSLGKTAALTPSPVPTVDAWFMDNLKNGLKEFLDSIYPAISAIETLTLPNTIIIDGSPYRIPAIALQTTTSSSSSSVSSASSTPSSISSVATVTPPPSSTATQPSTPKAVSSALSNTSASNQSTESSKNTKNSDGRRLGIILGVVLGLAILALLLLLLCLVRRRKKQKGYELKHEPPALIDTKRHETGDMQHHTWDGEHSHSAQIWSPTGVRTIPQASHASMAVPKTHVRSSSSLSKIPLLAGFLIGRRRSKDDIQTHEHGSWTPPGNDSIDAVAADGPYARATSAAKGTARHSYYEDSAISPVPDPYVRRHNEPFPANGTLTPVTEEQVPLPSASADRAGPSQRVSTPYMDRAPAAAMADAHGSETRRPVADSSTVEDDFGRAGSIAGSTRSTISRKPVPPQIRTGDVVPDDASTPSNPFASPADSYAMYTARGGPYSHRPGQFDDQRGEDFGYVPTPMLPPRSPERRTNRHTYHATGL